jgi:hypothetical protein
LGDIAAKETVMILLLAFAAIFLVGQVLNVGISIGVERFSEQGSLVVFFVLFAAITVFGWLLAVRLIDHMSGSQRAR